MILFQRSLPETANAQVTSRFPKPRCLPGLEPGIVGVVEMVDGANKTGNDARSCKMASALTLMESWTW
ncbi:hypothetical protein [Massilia niabensis]|uniref:Uncharacterized protein n=1 Tax=Massilia niabensis TaxID=544910 RepID=A0ABW0KZJ1_9BURK